MSMKFNDNIEVLAPKHLDARYSVFESGESRPFNSVQEALDLIPRPIRAVGLPVLIRVDGELRDYWFVDKDTLEEKSGGEGPPGPSGEDGEPGQDGKSAYEVWLEDGNTGTIDDYLTSLKGEKGEKGDDGVGTPQNLQSVLEEGNSAGNNKITDLGDPELESDAATKKYVDENTPTAYSFEYIDYADQESGLILI